MELAWLEPGLWQPQDPSPKFVGYIGIPVMAMEIDAQTFRVSKPLPTLVEQALEALLNCNAKGREREV
jgi:hypothetical protein